MTDHKFEPFQRVLVRDGDYTRWRADFFSHKDGDKSFPFCCVREDWRQCIPYTPETAHLIGTSHPYEPPKPPVEYEWGQKVEVREGSNWCIGIYVHPILETARWHSVLVGTNKVAYIETNIRPLSDDTANLDAKP